LEDRGFIFSASSHTYVNVAATHGRQSSSSSSSHWSQPDSPATPPPSSVSELQNRIISLLKRQNILPRLHPHLRLVQLGARNDQECLNDLQTGITKCLVHPPEIFSLTLTDLENPSLLLCSETLSYFGSEYNNVLLGSKDEYLAPITLNLQSLPIEATGIVCGVSSKLVGGVMTGQMMGAVEMRYLSTARGATVIVDEADLERAVELLSEGEHGLQVIGL
jgi:hypothetical protein